MEGIEASIANRLLEDLGGRVVLVALAGRFHGKSAGQTSRGVNARDTS